MVDSKDISDLLQFLSPDAKPECKKQAVEFLTGLSGDPEGVSFIRDTENVLESIVALTQDSDESIVKDIYKCLINIASEPIVCRKLLSLQNFLTDLLTYVISLGSEFAGGVCMLLINLSRHEDCAKTIVDTIIKNSETVGFDKIISAFCTINFNPKNSLHDLGPFLQNLSQIQEARQFIMDKERCVIERLLPFTEYKESVNRRKGIVGVLKNCCFDTDEHDWLLGPTIDILPRILLPLAGPEEFDEEDMEKLPDELQYLDEDKTREPDLEIRKMLVDAVIKLCSTRKGRAFVKSKNTYVIMREYHKWEKDEEIEEAIQACINVLIMDEPQEGMEDLETFDIPEDIEGQLDKMETSGGLIKASKKNADGSQWVKM